MQACSTQRRDSLLSCIFLPHPLKPVASSAEETSAPSPSPRERGEGERDRESRTKRDLEVDMAMPMDTCVSIGCKHVSKLSLQINICPRARAAAVDACHCSRESTRVPESPLFYYREVLLVVPEYQMVLNYMMITYQ